MAFTIEITDEQIKGIGGMLSDYFGIIVPNTFIEELLQENLYLVGEVISEAYHDTCARDEFADSICNMLEVGAWPVGGDTEDYKEEFSKQFKERAKAVGIEVSWENLQ